MLSDLRLQFNQRFPRAGARVGAVGGRMQRAGGKERFTENVN